MRNFTRRLKQSGGHPGLWMTWIVFALVAAMGAQAQSPEERDAWATERALLPGVKLAYVQTNGVRYRVAEMGQGPAVLLAHGWPESWYSWRHQLKALAAAGYRAIAPDMRGYGESHQPREIEAYSADILAADMVGILDALDIREAHMVGHDWGAPVAAHTVLSYPDRFQTLTLMSVPYGPRSPVSPMQAMRERAGSNFFYILYHNEADGVAENEYDGDPRGLLSRLYLSPDSPRKAPEVTSPLRSAGGWIPRLGAPLGLPTWLSQADLDYYVSQFVQSGFRGGLNYYRNIEANWQRTASRDDLVIRQPTLFIAGELDVVIGGASADQLRAGMRNSVPNLADVVLIAGMGHWVQQEAPEETNAALIRFIGGK